MKEQSCVIYTLARQEIVAGLSWQPLLSQGAFTRMAEIRRNAMMVDCGLYAIVKAGNAASGGFDDYEEGVAQEARKFKTYSLAAVMARAYADADTLVAWRIRSGLRIGEIALIVVEAGVPTLDVIVSESEAVAMMEYYQQSRDRSLLFRIVSNDSSLWVADSFIEEDAAFLKAQLNNSARINTIPLDYRLVLQATLGILMLLGLLMGYDYYQAEKQKRLLAAQIAAQDNTGQYFADLNARLGQVGLDTQTYRQLLNSLYDLPYFVNGWAMRGLICNMSLCTMEWESVGGYTNQISAAFDAKDGYVVQVNRTTPSKVTVIKDFRLKPEGPATWTQLPSKSVMDQWVLDQRQEFSQSKVDVTIFPEPEIWPTGYASVPLEQAVTRYRFKLTGGVAIAESFINNQSQPLYWDKLGMTIRNLEASGPRIEIELQGAYYAY